MFKHTDNNRPYKPEGDCVARMVCNIFGMDYERGVEYVEAIAKDFGVKLDGRNDGVPHHITDAILRRNGFVKVNPYLSSLNRRGHDHNNFACKLEVERMPNGYVVAVIPDHVTSIIKGVIHDTFDPTGEPMKEYWVYKLGIPAISEADNYWKRI